MEDGSASLNIDGESHDRDQDLAGAEPDHEVHVEADLVPPEGADRTLVQETEVVLIPNLVHDRDREPLTAAINAPEVRDEQALDLDLDRVQLRMSMPMEVTENFSHSGF